jgi:hypothetical protein
MEKLVMENEMQKTLPILEVAWTRYAQLDAASVRRSGANYRLRSWITILGVLATSFAILTQIYFSDPNAESTPLGLIVKILFVTTPILASIFAAFTAKFYANGNWLIYRAAAEEIKKEIYIFRTILQKNTRRNAYLEKRIAQILRELFRNLAADLSFEKYEGSIPPHHNPADPNSDSGFSDLTGDEYFRFRVQNQLDWHNRKINQFKFERRSMTIYILTAGGLGAVFAAWGHGLSLWVAFTAAITAALIGWQELRRVDATIKNYSRVVLEMAILSDHWLNLIPEERTAAEFYTMVRTAEEVLWSQNIQYTKFMQEALQQADLEDDAGLVNRVIQASVDSAKQTKQAMADDIVGFTQASLQETEKQVDESFKSVLGTLAEEASSEIVQLEIEALSKAVTGVMETIGDKASSFSASLSELVEEFANVEIGRDTKKEELNAILLRFPKTGDVKG